VNNAGFVLGVDRVGSIDDNEIDAMIATNVVGLVSVTQLLVKGEICGLASRSDTLSRFP
jgi:3-hydroxy acid dehydrogenase/malonic semialdehyde reductase